MTELYTVAFDGEVGLFPTYRTEERAKRVAAEFRKHFPLHTYDVVPETPWQARYAIANGYIVE